MGSLIKTRSQNIRDTTQKIACFPLQSILMALNRTTVDYFSLDVEGLELDGRTDDKEVIIKFMESNGYIVHKDIHVREPSITL